MDFKSGSLSVSVAVRNFCCARIRKSAFCVVNGCMMYASLPFCIFICGIDDVKVSYLCSNINKLVAVIIREIVICKGRTYT